MTSRLTPLTVSTLRLVALAVFLAVLVGRPELFLVALPLVLRAAATAFDRHPADYVVSREVSSGRLFEGDPLTVAVTVTAGSRVPVLELLVPLPAGVELATGSHRAVLSLDAGERHRWTFTLRCPARSRLALGPLHARLWGRSGLRLLEARHGARMPVRVYPRMGPLRRVPEPSRTQTSVGNYVSPTFGAGLEPGDIRPFAPGDRLRHVNWRASLRLGALHVTQYHQERNADVVLMLDTLSDVGARPETSLDLCVRTAASLSRAYLARKDRVGLIEYGGVLRWVRPGSGPVQLERILDALLDAQALFTYVRKDLATVPPRVLPPQALVVALSPLLDPRFVEAAADLAARGFDLIVLTVSPIDVTRRMQAVMPPEDLACRLWSLERRAQLADLRRRGLVVLEWSPGQPLEAALAALPRHRRRLKIAG